MKIKRILSTAVSGVLVLSLSACSFNPLGWFNKKSEDDIMAAASKINKDAVFKETDTFTLDGWDYFESIKTANGKIYTVKTEYEYPDYDYDYDEPVLFENETGLDYDEVDDDALEDNETDSDYDEIDADVLEDNEEGWDDIAEEPVYDEYSDVFMPYENYYGPEKVTMHVASFTNGSDVEEHSFEIDTNYYFSGQFCVSDSGNCYVIMNCEDYENKTHDCYLWKISLDGNIDAQMLLYSNDENGDDWHWISYIACDKDGNVYICCDGSVDIYSASDLSKIGTRNQDDPNAYCQSLARTSDGSVAGAYYSWTEDSSSSWVEKIAPNGSAEKIDVGDAVSNNELIEGVGYDLYYSTSTSFFGITGNVSTEVVNFYDSDISPDEYSNFIFTDKETFYAIKYGEKGPEIARFEKVPADQVVEKEVITIGAVYLDYLVAKQVMEFNKKNDKYKIKLVDYSLYNSEDDWSAGEKRLNSDLATGQGPDIISMESYKILNLMSKGVFEDLTPYMENGNGIKKSDLVYNAQNIYADGEKLYCIYPYFTVSCCMVDKKNYKENMTIDDVIAWEKATGNKGFSDTTIRDSMMYEMLSFGMGAFMDGKTGKCSFDSPEFIKMLEYTKSYPEDISDSYYDSYTYENYLAQYKNGKVLLYDTSIYNFRDFYRESYLMMGGNGIPCKYPIDGSEGAVIYPDGIMGINAKCKNKEAAWEFISSCFTEEFYDEYLWGLASVESILDKQIEEAEERLFWTNEDGTKEYYDDTVWLDNREVTVPPMTDEYGKLLKEFATNAMGVSFYDEDISKIIDEECQPFYSGQKSAKEVASIIQSRVQIYVNEKQ